MSTWNWKTWKTWWTQKRPVTNTPFEAVADEVVLGIDFELGDYVDKNGNHWASIKVLKNKFAGTEYKYNALRVIEPETIGDKLRMMMDYDFITIPKPFDQKGLSKDREFNNFVFNVAYTLIVMQAEPDMEEKDTNDIGTNDTGEPDSE